MALLSALKKYSKWQKLRFKIRLKKLFDYLSGILFFNFIIRFLIEGYLQQCINSLICLSTVSIIFFNIKITFESLSDGISSAFTIVTFAVQLAFPGVVLFLIVKFYQKLEHPTAKKRMGSIYLELKYQNRIALMYYVIFIVRRLILALVCIFITDFPFAQVMAFNFKCLIVIMYIYFSRPFESKLMNIMEMFNELCILIISYHLPLFTDFSPDPLLQYQLGYSVIAITVMNVIINMMVVLVLGIASLILTVKGFIKRIKEKLNKKKKARFEVMGANNNFQRQKCKIEIDETTIKVEDLENPDEVVNENSRQRPAKPRKDISRKKKRHVKDKKKENSTENILDQTGQNGEIGIEESTIIQPIHVLDNSHSDHYDALKAHVMAGIKGKSYAPMFMSNPMHLNVSTYKGKDQEGDEETPAAEDDSKVMREYAMRGVVMKGKSHLYMKHVMK